MNDNFQTPILFIVFNRPDTTRRVFEAIRKIKPSKLFIAADGPRENKLGEKEKCEAVRNIVKQIDWQCEVKTLFREKNLGCKWGPITAINWLFENEEEGIILEDDCLPHPSFFNFCTKLLNHYKNNGKIMHISGNNFQNDILRGDKKSSYYFSKYTHSWGWATWKRAWKLFNTAVESFPSFDKHNKIKAVPISSEAKKFWIKNFRQTINGNDSWDSLWMYTVWYYNGLAVLPQKNLVSNIGFGENATHTKETNSISNIKTLSMDKIVYNEDVTQDQIADDYTFETLFKISILKKILLKIRSIWKK